MRYQNQKRSDKSIILWLVVLKSILRVQQSVVELGLQSPTTGQFALCRGISSLRRKRRERENASQDKRNRELELPCRIVVPTDHGLPCRLHAAYGRETRERQSEYGFAPIHPRSRQLAQGIERAPIRERKCERSTGKILHGGTTGITEHGLWGFHLSNSYAVLRVNAMVIGLCAVVVNFQS